MLLDVPACNIVEQYSNKNLEFSIFLQNTAIFNNVPELCNFQCLFQNIAIFNTVPEYCNLPRFRILVLFYRILEFSILFHKSTIFHNTHMLTWIQRNKIEPKSNIHYRVAKKQGRGFLLGEVEISKTAKRTNIACYVIIVIMFSRFKRHTIHQCHKVDTAQTELITLKCLGF